MPLVVHRRAFVQAMVFTVIKLGSHFSTFTVPLNDLDEELATMNGYGRVLFAMNQISVKDC